MRATPEQQPEYLALLKMENTLFELEGQVRATSRAVTRQLNELEGTIHQEWRRVNRRVLELQKADMP